jgi:uncharacterized protein YutD
MIIDTQFGTYDLIKDYRNGFDITMFHAKYIPETFDKFTYIIGDISSGILRLKGFSNNTKSTHSYKKIPDYLNESCNMNTAYFILKKVVVALAFTVPASSNNVPGLLSEAKL